MAKITRMGSNQILSNSVEYHNFVFLAGITADDLSQDVSGQTRQVLAKIDAALTKLKADGTLQAILTKWGLPPSADRS